MKNISQNFIINFILLLMIISVISSSCAVCDCLEPCPGGGPIISIVEEESLPWFEYYQFSEEDMYLGEISRQRIDPLSDSIIISLTADTIQFAIESSFEDEVSCDSTFDCPNICEQITGTTSSLQNPTGISPGLILTAGRLSEENIINIETFSINQKSYRFSIRNDGEVINDIQVFNVKNDNRNIKYTSVSQEEIDRVKVSQLDVFQLDGKNYSQCYELLDSTLLGSNSFQYFRMVFSRNDGPIIFEDIQSSNEINEDERQFDLEVIKKLK